MAQFYSNPKREDMEHSLPNMETFYISPQDFLYIEGSYPVGWYYWTCFPGCMPDSDPTGPFETEAEAIADSQQY